MDPQTFRAPALRGTQLVLGAMAAGVLAFAAVVVALRLSGGSPPRGRVAELLPLLALGLAAAEVPVYLLLRGAFLARARESRAEARALLAHDRIAPPLHHLALVGGALLQGAGLLGVVAVLLGSAWWALAVPLAASAGIAALVPTRARLGRLLANEEARPEDAFRRFRQ